MVEKILSKGLALCTALALLILPLGPALSDNASANTRQADQSVDRENQKKTEEKRKTTIKEATDAIRETENALKALDEKHAEKAIKHLKQAIGDLEIILARDPQLALAPSGVEVITYDVLADLKTIKEIRDMAEDALEDGRVQEARRLLRGLASETVISVTHIPLATYPLAIRNAVRMIEEGKFEDAKVELQGALSTLVVIDNIIPLPVVSAQHLLKEAEKLAEKSGRAEEENKKLAQLLTDARTKLEFAQALGYGTKKQFKDLYKELDEIESKTEKGKSGTGFFDKIKGFLKDLVKSNQPDQSKK